MVMKTMCEFTLRNRDKRTDRNVEFCFARCYLINMKQGKLTQNKVHLKEHEYRTVKLLLDNGYDIELIPPSAIKGLRMPDIMMQGVAWEMKSPTGNGKNTLKNTIQNASHQSGSIIIDLRRTAVQDGAAVKELEKYFKLSRRLKRMKIICKDEEILDFRK